MLIMYSPAQALWFLHCPTDSICLCPPALVCAAPCSCGTFDIGATGSEGDTGSPRFGCNASLRKEVGPCLGGPGCWNGVERRFNLSTGAWMNETAFKSVEDK